MMQGGFVKWDGMASPEERLKSLELLHGIIGRLSTHSFLLKGWAVTLTAALLTLTDAERQAKLALLIGLPTVMFWALDAYLLARERAYRDLFEAHRMSQVSPFDFRLSVLSPQDWVATAFSRTLVVFYGLLLLSSVIVRIWR